MLKLMLKVLDTANRSICYSRIRQNLIDSNEEPRSCTRVIDSIRIKEDNYTYKSGLHFLMPICGRIAEK